jgi:hypothetical protein
MFSNMVNNLNNMSESTTEKFVTLKEYEDFKREFVFEKLKGKRLGQAFCEKFNMNGGVISILTNDEEADYLIKTVGFVK